MSGSRSQNARYRQLFAAWNDLLPALAVLRAQQFLAEFHEHGPAWIILGIVLTDLARYEEAEQALKQAIRLCPKKPELAFNNMGHLYRERGDYVQAAKWYRKAIAADPHDATSYIFFGAILAKQGRLHESEETHRTATKCPKGCIDEAFLNLGLVLRSQERFEEAAKCFREAIRLTPDYRDARQALRDTTRCLKLLRSRSS